MKNFLILGVLLACSCSSDDGNLYLNCFQNQSAEVLVDIQVPFNWGGLLTLDGKDVAEGLGWHYESRRINLGRLAAGDHILHFHLRSLDLKIDVNGNPTPPFIDGQCSFSVAPEVSPTRVDDPSDDDNEEGGGGGGNGGGGGGGDDDGTGSPIVNLDCAYDAADRRILVDVASEPAAVYVLSYGEISVEVNAPEIVAIEEPESGEYSFLLENEAGDLVTSCSVNVPEAPPPTIECLVSIGKLYSGSETGGGAGVAPGTNPVLVVIDIRFEGSGPYFLAYDDVRREISVPEVLELDLSPGKHCFQLEDVDEIVVASCCATVPPKIDPEASLECVYNELDDSITVDITVQREGTYFLTYGEIRLEVSASEALQIDLPPGDYTFRLENDRGGIVSQCSVIVPEDNTPNPEPVESYRAHSVTGRLSPPKYGMRLDGFFDGKERSEVTFDFVCVYFDIFEDGSARLQGHIRLAEVQICWAPDKNLEDFPQDWFLRIHLRPTEGSRTDYRYFEIIPSDAPQLVNMDNLDDLAQLKSYGPPYRMGHGANGKNDNFGASGWLNFSHGSHGSLETHIQSSDFLMDLVPRESDAVVLENGESRCIVDPNHIGDWMERGFRARD